jgi:hypothetical protein
LFSSGSLNEIYAIQSRREVEPPQRLFPAAASARLLLAQDQVVAEPDQSIVSLSIISQSIDVIERE